MNDEMEDEMKDKNMVFIWVTELGEQFNVSCYEGAVVGQEELFISTVAPDARQDLVYDDPGPGVNVCGLFVLLRRRHCTCFGALACVVQVQSDEDNELQQSHDLLESKLAVCPSVEVPVEHGIVMRRVDAPPLEVQDVDPLAELLECSEAA